MKQTTNHFWVSYKRKLQIGRGVASFIQLTRMHRGEGMDADSAAAMQLFLMNPQPRSPSPSPTQPSSSTPLHMPLPNPSSSLHTFHTPQSAETVIGNNPIPPSSQFTWTVGAGGENSNKTGIPESQGLSFSLSSSLQQLEAAKGDKLRMGDGVFYYKQKKDKSLKGKENRRLGVVF